MDVEDVVLTSDDDVFLDNEDDVAMSSEQLVSGSLPKPNLNLTGEKKFEAVQVCTDGMSTDSKKLLEESQCYASCYELTSSGVPELITIAITSSKLLKIRSNKVIQTYDDATTSIQASKILIHHEFLPMLKRYICILKSDGTLDIRKFENFKVIHVIPSVSNIKSVSVGIDPPILNIVQNSGDVVTWSPSLLGQKAEDQKTDECPKKKKTKEQMNKSFDIIIQDNVNTITRHQKTIENENVTIKRCSEMLRKELSGPDDFSWCSIYSVMFRIIPPHKLVIGIAVKNLHESSSLCNLSMTLTSLSSSLQFSYNIFTTLFNPRYSSSDPPVPSNVAFRLEKLSPNRLPPRNSAFIVASCTLPMFLSSNITIQGLLTYSTDTSDEELTENSTQERQTMQIPLPDIPINCLKMKENFINLDDHNLEPGFISRDSLAIMASTKQFNLILTSLSDDLNEDEIIESIGQHTTLKQLTDLTDAYVIIEPGLVQYCALILIHISANKKGLEIYADTLQQAMLISHMLRSSLPLHVQLNPSCDCDLHPGVCGTEEYSDKIKRGSLIEMHRVLYDIWYFLDEEYINKKPRKSYILPRKDDGKADASREGKGNAGTSKEGGVKSGTSREDGVKSGTSREDGGKSGTSREVGESSEVSREGRVTGMRTEYSDQRSRLDGFPTSDIVVRKKPFSERVDAFRKILRNVEGALMRHVDIDSI